MMNDELRRRFSVRYGFRSSERDELIREDAPEQLRSGLLQIVHDELNKSPSWLRRIICGVLRVREDSSNWSEYPNIWGEVQGMLYNCEWFKVYDIIEGFYGSLDGRQKDKYETMLNNLFVEEGIGWQLVDGELHVRGDEAFERIIDDSTGTLDSSDMKTAASELNEAIRDLSRRPEPDLSGAVHHAMMALECVAREISEDPKPTLGEIIKKHPDLFPRPIDVAVAKLWGYASDQARHGRESRDLAWEEAQLVVGVSAALCSYLAQKHL